MVVGGQPKVPSSSSKPLTCILLQKWSFEYSSTHAIILCRTKTKLPGWNLFVRLFSVVQTVRREELRRASRRACCSERAHAQSLARAPALHAVLPQQPVAASTRVRWVMLDKRSRAGEADTQVVLCSSPVQITLKSRQWRSSACPRRDTNTRNGSGATIPRRTHRRKMV